MLAAVTAAVLTTVRNGTAARWRPELRLHRDLHTVTATMTRAIVLATTDTVLGAAASGHADAVVELGDQPPHIVPIPWSATGHTAAAHRAVRAAGLHAEQSALGVYRRVAAAVAAHSAATEAARLAVAQRVLDGATTNGVAALVDRAGRAWSLPAYLEMLVRTLATRARVDVFTGSLSAAGHDLVVVGTSPQPCEVCAPFEGAVLSISGLSVDPPVLCNVEHAREAGLWHPNCRHRVNLWSSGGDGLERGPGPRDSASPVGEWVRRLRQARRRRATALSASAWNVADQRIRVVRNTLRQLRRS
ncbi:hypothetical protein AWN90_09350 [Nocardia terpenica]|uniref:Minor capsid protein n=2 Tax=Nocardia terpenica TaxID=455432 RepID=A0A164H259_9NOCA|nr:hypothetical protein AWN90_09350 [Nocardia terpenica]